MSAHEILITVMAVFALLGALDRILGNRIGLGKEFESGIQAVVEVGTNNYITQPRWYVLGETGTLQIDSWDCDGKIIRNIDKENVWEEQIIYTKAGPTKTMAPRNKNSTETIEIPNAYPNLISMLDKGYTGSNYYFEPDMSVFDQEYI